VVRIKPILRGYVIVFSILVVFPYFLIFTNNYFSLPICRNYIFQIIGFLSVLIGATVILYCLNLFVRIGKGAPVPTEQPRHLVSEGLYKLTRSPMYLAVFLILFGEFLLFGHFSLLLYFLISIPLFHFNVVYREEPKLKRKFGKEYINYMKEAPRWFPMRISRRT